MALFSFLRRMLTSAPEAPQAEAARSVESSGAFPILVAGIEGEGGSTAAAAVVTALGAVDGLTVQTTSVGIGSVDDTEVSPVSLGKAVAKARILAEAHGAASVVAGQMIAPTTVRLRFIAASVGGDPASGTWTVGDMVDIPVPFPPGGAAFVAACTAASLTLPSDEDRRTRLNVLRHALRAGEGLVQGEGSLSGAAKVVTAVSFAAMLIEMGVRTQQKPLLDRAQQVLRAVMNKAAPKATASAAASATADSFPPAAPPPATLPPAALPPVVAAAARLHLATIGADIGGRDGDTARLEEAGRQMQAAATVISGDILPEDNAAIWAQYGRAMHRLSALSGKTDHMKAAVQGYHLAAAAWGKGSNPDRWAELQYGMASVLGQFGEFTGSIPALERAVTVFEKVAEVWTREVNARRWAGLQNNIGACRFAQGKRSGALPPLRDAAERFSRALEVYQAANMTRNVHVTQKNIARVERLISVQEGGD